MSKTTFTDENTQEDTGAAVRKKHGRFRLFFQLAAAVLFNGYIAGFVHGRLFTGKTKLICLLGSPVGHSLSPRLHNRAFRLLGLDYVYLCFDVKEDALPAAVEGLKKCGARGFNLTMPDKNAILDLADELTPAVQLIGAANTVVIDDGRLTAYNTDGTGFLRALAEAGTPIAGQDVLLLGAGGAASAIAAQAALDGAASIRICLRPGSRFEKRAEQLASGLNRQTSCKVSIADITDQPALRGNIASSSVLINATSVGMEPHPERCLIPDVSWLRPDLTVADVIYHPHKTKLLSLAGSAGCRICPGAGMLLWQGAEAFRLWTGCEMPVEEVRKQIRF